MTTIAVIGAIAALGQAAGTLFEPINKTCILVKRQYDYVKKLEKNFKVLEKAEKDLLDKEETVNREKQRRELTMEFAPRTKTWLDDLCKLKTEIQTLKDTHTKAKKGLCTRLFAFCSLRKLGKDIVEKTKEIHDLHGKLPLQDFLIEKERPNVVMKLPKHNSNLQSFEENVETVLEYLHQNDIRKLGIWGQPGIGKTMIMKTLNDTLDSEPKFGMVIWVTVGKEGSKRTIQQAIVDRLNLGVDAGNCDENVADLISDALVNKRYLLLLDEVFSEINLQDVGIRHGHRDGKWVLACRCKMILDEMDVDDHVQVNRLSESDSCKLFRDLVGHATFDHPRIEKIAKRLVKECGGLPQVIKTVASGLKNERREDLWNNKLSRLRSPSGNPVKEMEEALKAFEISYEELAQDRKNCLKYGALFPEDYEVYQDYLMECWKAQRLLVHDVSTFRKAREEGTAVLKDLFDRALLERGRTLDCVKMSILCRSMTRGKYEENELLVGQSERIEFRESDWEHAKMITFMCTKLQNLPPSPTCHSLSTLFLQKNQNLVTIPKLFFKSMLKLNVLDLNSTQIESLPPSISCLKNLRGLYLNDCFLLRSLPEEFKDLELLEVLDIRGTGFQSLPIEISKLSKLGSLKVSFTCYVGNKNHVDALQMNGGPSNHVVNQNHLKDQLMEMVPINLEELVVYVDANQSHRILNNITREIGHEILHKIAESVGALTSLSSLCFYFPSQACFEMFSNKRNNNILEDENTFQSFYIQIGSSETHHLHGLDISGCSASRHLRYMGGSSTPLGITQLLKDACSFELSGHHDVQSLLEFGVDVIKCLEVCIIDECREMTAILRSNMALVNVLPYLKELHISRLQRLNCIWECPSISRSLTTLTTLTLNDCSNITKILSWGMTQQLPKLQHLRVEKCSRLVEVIEANTSSIQEMDGFPMLKTLELVDLPELVSICSDDSFKWPFLKKLKIKDCQGLNNLSLSNTNAPQLKSIECNRVWWNGINFINNDIKQHLERLCLFT